MKTLLVFFSGLIAICTISFYQSCRNADHIECRTLSGLHLTPLDITIAPFKQLNELDSVLAKKFAFSFEIITADTICMVNPMQNIISSAYAIKISSGNFFMKDSIESIEIYSTSNFNPQYPAGTILNNLFTIPTLQFYNYNNSYSFNSFSQLITLDEVPQQSDYYKFYVLLKTKQGKVLTDSLPTIKINI